MKKHIQISLGVAAFLYLIWAISFLIMPEAAHSIFSTAGKIDEGMMAMFGACLIALAIVFMLAAGNPRDDMVKASAASLGTIGVVAAYQIFVDGGINRNIYTVLSLVITAGLSAYLFMGLVDGMTGSGGRKKRKAPKKKTKKKVKKTKKKATKRRAR